MRRLKFKGYKDPKPQLSDRERKIRDFIAKRFSKISDRITPLYLKLKGNKYGKSLVSFLSFMGGLLFSKMRMKRRVALLSIIALYGISILSFRANSTTVAVAAAIVQQPSDDAPNTGGASSVLAYMQTTPPISWVRNFFRATDLNDIIDETIDNMEDPLTSSDIWDYFGWLIYLACAYRIVKHYLDSEDMEITQKIYGYLTWTGLIFLFYIADDYSDFIAAAFDGLEVNSDATLLAFDDAFDETVDLLVQLWAEEFANTGNVGNLLTRIFNGDYGTGLAEFSGFSALLTWGKIWFTAFFFIAIKLSLVLPEALLNFASKILLIILKAFGGVAILLSFFKPFKDTWVSWTRNMINVALWVPIFKVLNFAIIGIATAAITGFQADLVENAGFIWLGILVFILARNAISITLQASNSIVQGTSQAIGTAIGAASSLDAVNVGTKGAAITGGLLVGAAAVAATGGGAAPVVGGALIGGATKRNKK